MTPPTVSLSGNPQKNLTIKAFYYALAYCESPPPEMKAKINKVAAAVSDGDIEAISQLLEIAKSDETFYTAYTEGYKQLVKLNALPEREKDKKLPSEEERPDVPETPGILGNLLAPNPPELAKRDRRSSGEKFLGWLSQYEIIIRRK